MQRVHRAQVRVDGRIVGSCGPGLLVLAAAHRNDEPTNAEKLADRIWKMRILADPSGKMNLALKDVENPAALVVSNFTLYGDVGQRRPSFVESAGYEEGKALFTLFVKELLRLGCEVETGVFGADMDIDAELDGPVTLLADG